MPDSLTWERLSALHVVVQREPVSMSDLSAAERVTAPTMSRMVSALQERAFVRCVASRHDKRSVLVISTKKGRSSLEKGLASSLKHIIDALARLDSQALSDMADMIREVRDAKGDGTPPDSLLVRPPGR